MLGNPFVFGTKHFWVMCWLYPESGNPESQMAFSGIPDFRNPGIPDFRDSGFLEIRIPQIRSCVMLTHQMIPDKSNTRVFQSRSKPPPIGKLVFLLYMFYPQSCFMCSTIKFNYCQHCRTPNPASLIWRSPNSFSEFADLSLKSQFSRSGLPKSPCLYFEGFIRLASFIKLPI